MGEGGTVLVRRGALGDVVLLGAITARVPRPVTVVTRARYAEVAARLRGVDRVVSWESRARVEGRVIDLERSLRTLARFPGARRVQKHTLRRHLRRWGWGSGRPPVTALYARAAGVDAASPPWIRDPGPGGRALVLAPGASTALKAPPLGLLERAGGAWPGPVWILGGPGEDAVVGSLASRIPGARAVCEEGFAGTLRALGQAGAFVGGDSGLLHLARACGVPAVAVAGPTHPDDGFLVGLAVVQRALPCRPCTLHRGQRCRVGGRPCMEGLHPALQEALADALAAADR